MGTGRPSNKLGVSTVYVRHLSFLLIKPRVTQHAVIIISEYIRIFYGVRQLGDDSNFAKMCANMPGLAGNNNGGSDKCNFDYTHAN